MTNTKSPTPLNCFSTILQHLVCSNNLLTQTHPSPPHTLTLNHHHHHTGANVVPNHQSQIIEEPYTNPGIIARLMGLDSLPNPRHQNRDSLCRSKSLNSLRFLPDFDPARIKIHRRARTSSSFNEHEIGRKFVPKIDECSKFCATVSKECELEEKLRVKRKGEKYERRKKKESIVNNCKERKGRVELDNVNQRDICKIKNPNHQVEQVQSSALSRSSVSVLDHRHRYQEFNSSPKGKSRRVICSARRKKQSHNRVKMLEEKAPSYEIRLKLQNQNETSRRSNGNRRHEHHFTAAKAETRAMAMELECFGKILGHFCNKNGKKWMGRFQVFKVGFIHDLGKEVCQEILEFLIHQLINELFVS